MQRLVERMITTCWLLTALSTPMRGRARAEDDESAPEDTEVEGSDVDVGVGVGVDEHEREREYEYEHEREREREHEHAHGNEHAHERIRFGLDAVIGFGEVEAVTQGAPVPPVMVGGVLVHEAEGGSTSFIAGAAYQLTPGFGVGLRVPLALGSFESAEVSSRSAVALGNIELEAEYEAELAPGLELIAALGVALPTAGGEELPESGESVGEVPPLPASWDDYDAYTILRAAQLSRGLEDNALFESGHLGIVPKVGLDYETGAFGLELYVKLENLIGTGELGGYIGELVFGATAGYEVTDAFEIAARVWGNVNGEAQAAAAEPQLQLHVGPVDAVAGVILPIAGEPVELHYLGVRASVSAHL